MCRRQLGKTWQHDAVVQAHRLKPLSPALSYMAFRGLWVLTRCPLWGTFGDRSRVSALLSKADTAEITTNVRFGLRDADSVGRVDIDCALAPWRAYAVLHRKDRAGPATVR